ncbi:hypothetical protein MTO96_004034 [Rhipicephalus appendiculatus]
MSIKSNLNLCDGTTRTEKHLNKDWDNTCPVQQGTYTAELEFSLPRGSEAKEYFGVSRIPPVEILNVTISNAKLGSKIKFVSTVYVKTTVGKDPGLQLSFSKSDGTKLPCVDEVVPCNFKLCDGTTRIEKRLNKDWNNTCPVQRGTYTGELEFRLPGTSEAKQYFGEAVCSSQMPELTLCPGEQDPTVQVTNVTIRNAKLGEKMKIDAAFTITEPLDSEPVLYVSFARPNGTELWCPDYISQCELKLCNGTKIDELQLSQEWHNKCPVPAGDYTAHVCVRLLDIQSSEEFIGDGNVVVTLKTENGGEIVNCVYFTAYVEE